MMRPAQGYTLLELTLVLGLIAMLSAIAIPAYRGYTTRAANHAAIADIGELSLHLYRWEVRAGTFPATLAAAGLDGRLDPWGRPYVYLDITTARPGDVRKDKNLIPINTDFDLYSKGPDGRSALPLTAVYARDDIVRANNGAFVGVAADY